MGEWKAGDRCLVKADERWLLPTRKFAAEGRPATVISTRIKIFGADAIKIEFDVKRKGAQPHTVICYAKELLPLEPPQS